MNKKIILFSTCLLIASQLLIPTVSYAANDEPNSQNVPDDSLYQTGIKLDTTLDSTNSVDGNKPTANSDSTNTANSDSTNSVDGNEPTANSDSTNSVDGNRPTANSEEIGNITNFTDINITSANQSSLDNPFNSNDSNHNFITYKYEITNKSNTGAIIPAGTKISLDMNAPLPVNKMFEVRGLQTQEGFSDYFSVSMDSNTINLTVEKDLVPGNYNVFLYLKVQDIGWNWDGLNNKDNPAIMEGTVSSNLIDKSNNILNSYSVTPSSFFIKPNPDSPVGGLAGYTVGGYNNNNINKDGSISVDNGYPSNFIKSNKDGNWFNPSVNKINGKYYQEFIGSYLPAQLGVGKPIGLSEGEITLSFDHPVDESSIRVALSSFDKGNGKDVTGEPGINLSISSDKKVVTVEFSDFMQQSATYLVNQWRTVDLMVAVPIDSVNDVVNGKFNLKYPGVNWNSSFKGIFSNIDESNSEYPYFRGNDVTIYNTDSPYNPLTDIHSFIGESNNDANISITNLNGYPTDGVNPAPGEYNIEYQATAQDQNNNQISVNFTRKITVLKNQQSITGSDYSMYLGDKDATVADFKPSATDKDGNAIDVTADFSNVDFSKTGTYNVDLKSTDGQTKSVKLTIEDKKANTVKVTFNTGKGGSLQGTTTIDIPKGSKVTDLPKTVADKSNVEDIYFLDWYQNGKVVNPKTVTINNDTTFTAKFGAAVYRLYNKNNGDHLLTKNKDEKNKVAAKGWKVETNPKNEYGRAAFYVPVQADSAGKKQVYRIYNPNSGEHFYTTNKSEADAAVKKGWRHETDSNYTWVSEGDVKIYREFNPDIHTAGSHNFTTDLKEHKNVVKAGWRDESKDSSLWTSLKAGF